MKTIQKVVAPAITISFDEFIFFNRNQAYGAFELRKKYKRRLFIAFTFAFVLFGTTISIPLIKSYFAEPLQLIKPKVIDDITLTPVEKITIPPPPPVEKLSNELMKRISFAIPVVVDTLNENDEPLAIADPDAVGSTTGNETNWNEYEAIPPTKDEIIDITDEPLVNVQEQATYDQGSINNFSKYVGKNLTIPESLLEIGINGKTTVQFIINRNGDISDIKILRSLHTNLDQEIPCKTLLKNGL